MRLPGFCGTRRRALAALVQRFLAVEEVSYTRSGVPQRAGWSFGGQDLSRFAMLVSYRPLARTGLAWLERVRDAIGGKKEVFGREF